MILAYISKSRAVSRSTVAARIEGKGIARTRVAQVRLLAPVSPLDNVCDAVLDGVLQAFMDQEVEPGEGTFIGEWRGGQSLDIAHEMAIATERMLDSRSVGGMAQADILKCNDCVDILHVARDMLRRRLQLGAAAGLVRLQLVPCMCVSDVVTQRLSWASAQEGASQARGVQRLQADGQSRRRWRRSRRRCMTWAFHATTPGAG